MSHLTDEELKKYLLKTLSKEALEEILAESLDVDDVDFTQANISPTQKYYLSRKIPGSKTKCGTCGQSKVNDDQHATELIGGEKN